MTAPTTRKATVTSTDLASMIASAVADAMASLMTAQSPVSAAPVKVAKPPKAVAAPVDPAIAAKARCNKMLGFWQSQVDTTDVASHTARWAREQTAYLLQSLTDHNGDAVATLAVFDADRAERRARRLAKHDATVNSIEHASRPAAKPVAAKCDPVITSLVRGADSAHTVRLTVAQLAERGIIVA